MKCLWPLVLSLFLPACNGCKPGVDPFDSDDRKDSDRVDTGPDDPDTGAPPGPCAYPESEPNNALLDANELLLEAEACGSFHEAFDVDFWQFDLPQDSWLSVTVQAQQLGSWSDVTLVLTHEGSGAVEKRDNEQDTDVFLLYPALAGSYLGMVGEQNGQGDEAGYTYGLRASVAKNPVSFNREEDEPNATAEQAQELADGDALFGFADAAWDTDWYVIDVPAGKHYLDIDMQAYSFGSAGNFKVSLYDASLTKLTDAWIGQLGWELDPYLSWTSSGSEELYVHVVEQSSRGGRGYWYLLDVTLVGDE